MRAYLAVLKDAFRETLASKVLWVLLILITGFLVLFSGLSVAPAVRTGLDFRDVFDWPDFVVRLRDVPADSPVGRLRHRLTDELQKQVESFTRDGGGRRRFLREIREAIDSQLETDDFATVLDVADESLSDEARKLKATGDVSKQQRQRLNRLVLEAALPDDVRPSPRDVVTPTYLGYVLFDDFSLDDKELDTSVKGVLQAFIFFFVSVLGTFIAILVTAPIVPRMFEPGAIDLLLSKPVSRSLVFLSKFFGGCAFTLLNAGYLIIGMWLIVGWRFGIWSDGLLLSLPIYLFLFVLYYSVSAATGVLFRGPILSVVMVVVFWFACFVVDAAKSSAEQFELNGTRVHTIVPAGEALLATSSAGKTFGWSKAAGAWEEVFDSTEDLQGLRAVAVRVGRGFPFLGPLYDPEKQRLVAVSKAAPVFLPGGGPGRLFVAGAADNWSRRGGITVPLSPRGLFLSSAGEILVIGPGGLFRFEGNPEKTHRPFKIFGLDFGNRDGLGKFVEATAGKLPRWPVPFAAAMDPATNNIVVYSKGQLALLARGEGETEQIYSKTVSKDLATEKAAILAIAGDRVLVALAEGNYRMFDARTLQPVDTQVPGGPSKPRWAAGSSDGRFLAVLNHTGQAWLFDTTTQRLVTGRAIGGTVRALAFTEKNTLLVGDLFMRINEYQLPDLAPLRSFDPPLTTLQAVYHYALLPIYTVFPKPGQLNAVVQRLFEDEDTVSVSGDNDDLQADQFEIDVRTPLVSNAMFLVVILGLTCLYVSRKDF
jgi:ABC-type transport system involved in multi-copper enzyme maturation permease subunit